MSNFPLMKVIANLDALKYELSLVPLQTLCDHKIVSFRSIKALQGLLASYVAIINRFYKLDNGKWDSLFGIGVKELNDHMRLLVLASDHDLQSIGYNDCHNYLSASIQDAIDTLI
jgi:hypothetical protein